VIHREAYQWLVNDSKETAVFDSIRSLLVWDQRTCIPVRGQAHRAEQLGVLTRLLHARRTNPVIGENLTRVESSELAREPLSPEAVNAREWRRAYDKAIRIPERLAVELAHTASEGQACWQAARPRNDWEAFRPYLTRIVQLKREEAECLGYTGEPYDALLDRYEPDETAEGLEPLFASLRDRLVALLQRILGSETRPDSMLLRSHFPADRQDAFARLVLERIGYQFEAGRLDPTAHPFTVGIGPGDVRITARYNEAFFGQGIFGAVHEAGHALYDAGLPDEHWGTPLGEAMSLGIHESQSRMWENMVARSPGFWEFFYPLAEKHFSSLSRVSLQTFVFAINEVQPSLIRTEADEVTYNLHVLLRFEIERALLKDAVAVGELPEVWNEKMKAYLGVVPRDHSSGLMQDVHWSSGAIGYFPTYTLGNLYAAQFYHRVEQEVGDLQQLFSRGEFEPLLLWLRRNIHSEGNRYHSRELARKVTGEDLNSRYLVDYLERKYGELYGLRPDH
jgi:carboxypeptidase Taq